MGPTGRPRPPQLGVGAGGEDLVVGADVDEAAPVEYDHSVGRGGLG